jgi:thiamine biosynthesis lipoprotein
MKETTPITLSLHAMATRFELVLYGKDEIQLRSIGEEALGEIERLDEQLSYYRGDSEISWINRHAARQFVKVEPRLFKLLKHCAALHLQTDSAFDITIAPLMRAWHFVRDKGSIPTRAELQQALDRTGLGYIEFDDEAMAIRFQREGVEIDLGGFGKGYAVGRAIALLKEGGVKSALLHGGTSSIATIGTPPGQKSWRITLQEPFNKQPSPVIHLIDKSFSLSAIHGKSFTADGKRFGHIIHPQTGEPIVNTLAAAVIGADAAICEALSKTLLIHSSSWLGTLEGRFPDYECLVAEADDNLYGNLND